APALIYIVDDDLSIARLLTHVLTEFGFLAEAFGTGAAVLRRLQTTRPDLCIVDLGLPDKDGIELVRQIALQSHAGVLILTGRGHTVDRVMGLEL
ncbi:response regulator transcription factor, partial [Salmonella sp. s51884]|uniref:response regulator transcription factor n=1 Tax=Salmonella sp. s51884 TaxID=3159654 RepID=UPI00397FDE5A